MSIISASTLTTTALQLTADTAGTLVFRTGATPTTALTLNADQSATFAGAVNFTTAGFTNLSITGVATFAAGTVSLPSITTAGDTNTGIYFPAADTIAFTEGGVEAMRINSSAQIGIGTSSPVYQTQIYGSGQTTAALTDAGNKGGSLLLNTPAVVAGDGGALLIGAGGSGAKPFAAIKGLLTDGGNNTTGDFAFSTRNASTDTALTERMRITAGGNVGIGTSAPTYKLSVAGGILGLNAAGTDGFLNISTTGVQNTYLGFNNSGSTNANGVLNNNSYVGNGNAYGLQFLANGGVAATINTSGNLGIGTTSPDNKLEVVVGDNAGINIEQSGSLQTGYLNFRDSDGTLSGRFSYDHGNDSMRFNTGTLERMRINANGEVGIGTSSPSQILTLSSNSTTGTAVNIINSSAGGYNWNIFSVGSAASLARVGSLAFRDSTNGVTRMGIDTSGGVGIGNNAEFSGTVNSIYMLAGRIQSTKTDDWNMELSGGSQRIRFYTSAGGTGTTVGSITVSTSATTYSTSSDYRLKENIKPMTGALAKVQALKPVTYKWKVDGSDGQGFIAHELQAVVPDAVVGEKDGEQMQGVDTSFLVATLVAAIQELKAEFDEYKASHP
jgi:hypothetical protein